MDERRPSLAESQRLLAVEEKRVRAGEDASSELLARRQARIQIEQEEGQLRTLIDAAQAAASLFRRGTARGG